MNVVPKDTRPVPSAMRERLYGINARVIGKVTDDNREKAMPQTRIGGTGEGARDVAIFFSQKNPGRIHRGPIPEPSWTENLLPPSCGAILEKSEIRSCGATPMANSGQLGIGILKI